MLLVKTNPAMGGVVLVLLVHLISQSSAISIDSVKEHVYRSNFTMQGKRSVQRNSDPAQDVQAAVSINWDVFPNMVLGNPADMDKDIPAAPLTPDEMSYKLPAKDFIPDFDFPEPLELAGAWEGDIVLESLSDIPQLSDTMTPNEFLTVGSTRNAIIEDKEKWTKNMVPYVISSAYSLEERGIIGAAMTKFHEETCIRFVPRIQHRDYIHIHKGQGCSSSVGRVGGSQSLSLGTGCIYVGIVMHELMHAVGFWHEQSRFDRDDFIEILWNNIKPGMDYNFLKYDWGRIQSLGYPYDLGSIMHYGPKSFAKQSHLVTIRPKRGGAEIGQRRGFSETDIGKLNLLYECGTQKPTETVTTPGPSIIEDCTDFYDTTKCSYWADIGECQKNPSWMKFQCKKSCGECQTSCVDTGKYCDYWGSIGECRKNAEYMLLYCQKACNACSPHSKRNSLGDSSNDCSIREGRGECETNPAYMQVFCSEWCF